MIKNEIKTFMQKKFLRTKILALGAVLCFGLTLTPRLMSMRITNDTEERIGVSYTVKASFVDYTDKKKLKTWSWQFTYPEWVEPKKSLTDIKHFEMLSALHSYNASLPAGGYKHGSDFDLEFTFLKPNNSVLFKHSMPRQGESVFLKYFESVYHVTPSGLKYDRDTSVLTFTES